MYPLAITFFSNLVYATNTNDNLTDNHEAIYQINEQSQDTIAKIEQKHCNIQGATESNEERKTNATINSEYIKLEDCESSTETDSECGVDGESSEKTDSENNDQEEYQITSENEQKCDVKQLNVASFVTIPMRHDVSEKEDKSKEKLYGTCFLELETEKQVNSKSQKQLESQSEKSNSNLNTTKDTQEKINVHFNLLKEDINELMRSVNEDLSVPTSTYILRRMFDLLHFKLSPLRSNHLNEVSYTELIFNNNRKIFENACLITIKGAKSLIADI